MLREHVINVQIGKGKSHRRSPHVLSISKSGSTFASASQQDIATRTQKQTTVPHNALEDTDAVVTHHQFTDITPLSKQHKKQGNTSVPMLDLVNKHVRSLKPSQLTIDHQIEQEFARFHHAAKHTHTRLSPHATERNKDTHTDVPPHKSPLYVIKTTFIFALFVLIVSAPLYTSRLVASAYETRETLVNIASSVRASFVVASEHLQKNNPTEALQEIQHTTIAFEQALTTLKTFEQNAGIISAAIPKVRSQIKTARALSSLGLHITSTLSILEKLQQNGQSLNVHRVNIAMTDIIKQLNDAQKNIDDVDVKQLPKEIQQPFGVMSKQVPELVAYMRTVQKTIAILDAMFSAEPRQTLLVVFQNNHEMRASGGFWGSFALLSIKNSLIESIKIPGGGTYDIKGQLDRSLRPPTPMQLVAKEWQFQDANWFPDFPTSVRAATWFLEHSNNGTPDGAIALNPQVLEKILEITGPIELSKYNKTFTSENVTLELQKAVELEYDKAKNTPKAIIGDLVSALLVRMQDMNINQAIGLFSVLHDALNSKNILLYHQNTDVQKQLDSAGWAGTVTSAWRKDYLMVVNHNIAGQKTDGVISQTIDKKTVLDANGSLISNVTIRRTHHGVKGDVFSGVRNVNYLRVLVPEGSTLLKADGFTYPDESFFKTPTTFETHELISEIENSQSIDQKSGTHITRESGKTAFGNWVMTDPGQTSEVHLSYQLPFTILPQTQKSIVDSLGETSASYSLLVQKQPGADRTHFTHSLTIPNSWKVISSTHGDNGVAFDTPLETDLVSGIVMKQTQ